jgi:hypothetical protein
MKIKVFSSGSCRLLNSLFNTDKIDMIHNLHQQHFLGTNFMGKFHDTKCHIQFILFLKNLINLDDDILKRFFTSYNIDKWSDIRIFDSLETIEKKLYNLKNEIDNCDIYIFEICSLKLYKYKNFFCQFEQMPNNDISEYDTIIQSEDDLFNDLYIIKSFFPNKKIIFQCHFRPNIINNDEKYKINNREIIYSCSNESGEGEHKILKKIKYQHHTFVHLVIEMMIKSMSNFMFTIYG